jgi:hypothetical protein
MLWKKSHFSNREMGFLFLEYPQYGQHVFSIYQYSVMRGDMGLSVHQISELPVML